MFTVHYPLQISFYSSFQTVCQEHMFSFYVYTGVADVEKNAALLILPSLFQEDSKFLFCLDNVSFEWSCFCFVFYAKNEKTKKILSFSQPHFIPILHFSLISRCLRSQNFKELSATVTIHFDFMERRMH